VRNAKGSIKHLWDEQGKKEVKVDQIKKEAVEYYQKLLGSTSNEFDGRKARRVNQLLKKQLTEDQIYVMQKDDTKEEIKSTMFAMKSNRASGLYGFSAGFFKVVWPIVCEDVIASIKSFFETLKLFKEVNATIITLAPKKLNHSSIS
jgi:hypothetical protein